MNRPVSHCHSSRRRGTIAVMVAVSLIALLGIVALVLEGGQLFDKRRQLQSAADAAAYAGAMELLAGGDKQRAWEQAKASAEGITEGNGFVHDGANTLVTVSSPPQSGSHAGRSGYIEVVIEYIHTRSLSRIFGVAPLRIQARAVASGTFEPTKASVLILEPKKKGALKLDKANLITRGDIIVNSTSKDAVKIKKGSQVQAENLIVTGRVHKGSRNMIAGEVFQESPPTPDPLAGLPEPVAGPNLKAEDLLSIEGGRKVYRLIPGKYDDLKFDHDDLVIMAPGTYHLGKEGLQIKDHASLQAFGVLLVNTGRKDVKFETDGSIQITPPTFGPYAGISIFQDESEKKKVKFRNDGEYAIQGTIYAPNGEVRFQKIDLTLGGFADDDDEESADDESDDGGEPEADSSGSISATIVARKLKIDKKSRVEITGSGIDANKPSLAVVE